MGCCISKKHGTRSARSTVLGGDQGGCETDANMNHGRTYSDSSNSDQVNEPQSGDGSDNDSNGDNDTGDSGGGD